MEYILKALLLITSLNEKEFGILKMVILSGSFGQELIDNPNQEENAEEGEDNSQITVINWTTDAEIYVLTRELYKVEETLFPPEE